MGSPGSLTYHNRATPLQFNTYLLGIISNTGTPTPLKRMQNFVGSTSWHWQLNNPKLSTPLRAGTELSMIACCNLLTRRSHARSGAYGVKHSFQLLRSRYICDHGPPQLSWGYSVLSNGVPLRRGCTVPQTFRFSGLLMQKANQALTACSLGDELPFHLCQKLFYWCHREVNFSCLCN